MKQLIPAIVLGLTLSVVTSTESATHTCDLHQYVERGDADGVRHCIAEDGNPNMTIDSQNNSLLHIAVEHGFVKVVRELLDGEAYADYKNLFGYTPLHWAAVSRKPNAAKIIRMLIDRGANPNTIRTMPDNPWKDDVSLDSDYQYNALHFAVHADIYENVAAIVDNTRDDWRLYNGDGDTALHMAAYTSGAIVRLLLDNGYDPNRTSKIGITALHCAASKEIVDALIEKGADPNHEAGNGYRPMHSAAAMYGRERVLESLMDAGADPNARASKNITALHVAATNHKAVYIRVLIAGGADPNAVDSHGNTALHNAAAATGKSPYRWVAGKSTKEGMDTFDALIEGGVDISKTNHMDWTAFDIVRHMTGTEITELDPNLQRGVVDRLFRALLN